VDPSNATKEIKEAASRPLDKESPSSNSNKPVASKKDSAANGKASKKEASSGERKASR